MKKPKAQTCIFILLVALFLGLTTFAVLSPPVVHAQGFYGDESIPANCTGAGGFVPLECFKGSRKLADAYNTPELGPFMNKVFAGAISLGAILAVFRLAWAGFKYMSSDLPGMKSDAKEIISETLLGVFLLLGIWLILYQINPDILKLKIDTTSSSGGGIPDMRINDLNQFSDPQLAPRIDPYAPVTDQ